MEHNSEESRSVAAMSIFGQSIDARRSVRTRRRATQKVQFRFFFSFYLLHFSVTLADLYCGVPDIHHGACRNFHLRGNHRRHPAWRGCTSTSAGPSRSESAPVPRPACQGRVPWLPSWSGNSSRPTPRRSSLTRRSSKERVPAAEGRRGPSTSTHPAPIRPRIGATRCTSR